MKNSSYFFILLMILNFSCNKNSKEKFKRSIFWEKFKTKLEKNDLEYLSKNSFDSIKCVDCVPSEGEKFHTPEFIFKNYKNQFYDKELLDNKKYSIFKDDTIMRIVYQFKKKIGNENYDLIYMFDKKENKFLLSRMITVP